MSDTIMTVRQSELLEALSLSLDLIMGQKSGHCQRAGRIAVALGRHLGLPDDEVAALYDAALLKDSGCATIRGHYFKILRGDEIRFISDGLAEDDASFVQTLKELASVVAPDAGIVERAVRILGAVYQIPKKISPMMSTRVERSASIAAKLGFPQKTQDAVRCIFERWDGRGLPRGLRGRIIPPPAQVLAIATFAEILSTRYGRQAATDAIGNRGGAWFDPELANAFVRLAQNESFWDSVDADNGQAAQWRLGGEDVEIALDDERLRNIADVFAEIVDAKSQYTASHSQEVAFVAESIGRNLGLPALQLQQIRIGALLHDVGKLSVPNSILDKPARLTDDQWRVVRGHPAHTRTILGTIAAFDEVARMAGDHHERPDGRGYPEGLGGEELRIGGRIIAVADVYQALKADRPYRRGLEESQVLDMLRKESGTALDAEAVNALSSLL